MLLLRNVKKSYREPDGNRLPILDIERFAIAAGEQVVLVGRSGCGKTTLLHTIAGITRADSGEIIVSGIDIATKSEPYVDRVRAAKIGYVFQTFNLLPGFSALENVLLGMTFSGGRKDPARARRLLVAGAPLAVGAALWLSAWVGRHRTNPVLDSPANVYTMNPPHRGVRRANP